MMQHVITEVPFYRDRTLVPGYDVGGKTGTAQIWDPKANDGRGAWKHNLFNYSFVGYIGRETGIPDLVVAIQIEEGTPTVAQVGQPRDAGHVVRAVPADRDRRDHDPGPAAATAAGTRGRPDADRGPVTAACATLATVTDVDPSTPAPGAVPAPALTADDLVRLTGGRLLARSDRPIRGAAVDSRLVAPGQAVRGPARRADRRPRLRRRRGRARRGGRHRRPGPSPTRRPLGDVTVVRVADAAGRARRGRGRLAAPVRPARRRRHREHRQDLDQGGGRGRPRAPLPDAAQRGQPEQRDRPAADRPAPRPGARGGGPRDGHVRRRRDRRPGPDRPAADRRRDRRPAGPPRRGSGRSRRSRRPRASWSRRCRRTAPRSSTPTTRASGGWARRTAARSPDATASRTTPTSAPRRSTSAGLDGMRFTLRAGRRAPAGHDPDPRPAVGPQRARRGGRRPRRRAVASTRSSTGLRGGWSAPHAVQLVRLGGVTIIDDSYNASPGSVRRRARPAGRAARPAGRGPRRDARAGRGAATSGHRAVGEAAAATRRPGSSSSAPAPRGDRRGRRARPASTASRILQVRDARGRPRRAARRACATATSSSSRRRAGSTSTASSTACARELGERAPPMTVELIQGLLLAFALVVILMPPYIRLLRALGFGKRIRAGGPGEPLRQGRHADDGRPARSSPSSSAIYFFLRPAPDASTFAPLAALAGVGALGAFDDYLNAKTGEGIRARQKLHLADRRRVRRGLADPADLRHHGHRGAVRRRRSRSTRGSTSLFAAFAIIAAANGVNITDGLDGLSGGTLAIAFVAYMLIALLNAPDPAEPGPAVRADHRRAARVPVVQRPPGPDLHRRLGRAVAGGDAGGHRAHHRPDPGPAADRDHLRHRDRVGDPPGRLLQADAAASGSSG